MAEITLDAPPADPIEVSVTLDAPPAAPRPVSVTPDGPPAEPIPVEVSPDGPPAAPVPVDVRPDAPPKGPVPVPTFPDLPPRQPVPVTVEPDRPPAPPVEVFVSPDAPPRAPIAVSVTPDGPPGPPIAVSVTPDLPPGPVVAVEAQPDRPPAAPIAVSVTPSPPPAQPFPVETHPDLPAIQIPGTGEAPPTIDQIIGAVKGFDLQLAAFLSSLAELDPITGGGPGSAALDPVALARWFSDYRRTVGDAGVARFIEEQSVLYAMNPVVARVFDPTYFLKMLVPGSMGHVKTALDVEAGITMQTVAEARDLELQAAVFANPGKPSGDGTSTSQDTFGPNSDITDGQAFTVDAMVDAAVPGLADTVGGGQFLKRVDGIMRFDATSFFEARDSFGAQRLRVTAQALANSGQINAFSERLAASNALDGVVRATFPGEDEDGAVRSTTQDPSDVVDDDDARVPLSFTDLRKDPVSNSYRSVYFRALNLDFSTNFTPEYSDGSTFGRVDPSVGYQKTSRTISLSFEVHAFAPEDLRVIYNKMTWLESMCYPSFGDDSVIRSGPVTRLRIGDVVSTDLGGVPGVIRSLAFNFDGTIWELKRSMKVPRSFKVAVEFLVLHDGPVGIVNGAFGVFQLPPTTQTGDTNLAGNPTDSRDDGSTPRVSLLPGRFSKFGEPRR